jgi:hypothetical protein
LPVAKYFRLNLPIPTRSGTPARPRVPEGSLFQPHPGLTIAGISEWTISMQTIGRHGFEIDLRLAQAFQQL